MARNVTSEPIYVYYWTSYDDVKNVPYSFVDSNTKQKREGVSKKYSLVVVAYGVNERGESICIRFVDCYRRVLFEFPDYVDLSLHTSGIINEFKRNIYSKKIQIGFRTFNLLYKAKCTKKMLEVSFDSNRVVKFFQKKLRMRELENVLKIIKPEDSIVAHEIDAPAELQLMTARQIPPTGWISCGLSAKLVYGSSKISRCDYEIICTAQQVHATPNPPNIIPPLVVAAWDSEAYINDISSPGSSEDDAAFQISIATSRGEKFLLTLGDPLIEGDADFWATTEVLRYKTERDLWIGFGDQMRKIKPHVVTGYNLKGFDWELLSKRTAKLQCLRESLDFMMHTVNYPIMKEKEMDTQATGKRRMVYPEVEGVIIIDMLLIVLELNLKPKLTKYSLDFVCRKFLNEGKDDVNLSELFSCYRSLLSDVCTDDDRRLLAKVGKYCVQDSVLTIRLNNKLQSVLSLLEYSAVAKTQPSLVHTCGQQLRFYNAVYYFCRLKMIAVQSNQGEEYANESYIGALVREPIPGLYKFVVSFDFASMYPSIIIAENVDFSTVMNADAPLPDGVEESDFRYLKWEDHMCCEHDDLVIQHKKLSEINDLMREMKEKCIEDLDNSDIDPETLAKMRKISAMTPSELFLHKHQYASVDKRLKSRKSKFICKARSFKIYQKETGVLPRIIGDHLKARKEARKLLATETNPEKRILLNGRQLAHKVAANSQYGVMGVSKGRLKCKNAAMCVTALGREYITLTQKIQEDYKIQQIYGDTDSVYGRFPELDNDPSIKTEKDLASAVQKLALKVAKETTERLNKPPMAIEFEDKIYRNYFILSKKRYVFETIDENGVVSPVLEEKGVATVKRNYNSFVKRIYSMLIRMVFENQITNETLQRIRVCLAEEFIKLCSRHYVNKETNKLDINEITTSLSVHPLNSNNQPVQHYNDSGKVIKTTLYGYTLRKPDAPPEYTPAEKQRFFVAQLPPQMQRALTMVSRGYQVPDGNRVEYCSVKRPKCYAKSVAAQTEDVEYVLRNGENIHVNMLDAICATFNPLNEIVRIAFQHDDPISCVYDTFKQKQLVLDSIKAYASPHFLLKSSVQTKIEIEKNTTKIKGAAAIKRKAPLDSHVSKKGKSQSNTILNFFHKETSA